MQKKQNKTFVILFRNGDPDCLWRAPRRLSACFAALSVVYKAITKTELQTAIIRNLGDSRKACRFRHRNSVLTILSD